MAIKGSKNIHNNLSYLLHYELFPLNPKIGHDDVLELFTKKVGENLKLSKLLKLEEKEKLPPEVFEAFLHKSLINEFPFMQVHNERLEFLGDAVLQLMISQEIYHLHPEAKEGMLSKLRSSLVNEKTLYELAKICQLDQLILLGKGELKGEGHRKFSLLANCFEALIGALSLAKGHEVAKAFALDTYRQYEQSVGEKIFSFEALKSFDAKSQLQELIMHEYKETPRYEAYEVEVGKLKLFHISIYRGDILLGELRSHSKKKGMQELAKKVLKKMGDKHVN